MTQKLCVKDGLSHPESSHRVMMVVPQYPYPVIGGLERQAHELAKALLEMGYRVQVLSGKVRSVQAPLETVDGIPVHRIPWSQRKWLRFLRTPFDVLRVLHAQRDTYDVLHLHQHSWFGLFTIVAARLLGKPILTKLPSVGDTGIPGILDKRFGRFKLSILLRSDALVAMTGESLQELENVDFPATRILAISNGIRLVPGIPVCGRKRESAISCHVVYVGRLSEEKNINTLLSAWRDVVEAVGESVVLELWGLGPLESRLRQLSHDLGIINSVKFRGHVDGVRDRLESMDIFVLPSRVEGNSNAILEAMAAGLPIVSTNVGGNPMLVGPEGEDFLFHVGDQDTLALHIRRLIQDPVLRETIGAAMRRRIEVYFDIHNVARTYADAYRLLIAGERNRVGEVSNPAIIRGN